MILALTAKDLRNQDKTLLIDTIYKNFLPLATTPRLNHTKNEIQKILNSDGVILFLVLNDNKIIGYLLAEVLDLEDKRHVLFISYIYVVKFMRNKKLGCKLMSLAISYGIEHRLDGIMLIYNTSDKRLERFYDKYGFMLDFHLRRYELHDVFFKILP
jgi:ribosomal protein S18 acetylase RimI-like enzyme